MSNVDEKLTPFQHNAQNYCFGCGPANPAGMHLDFYLTESRSVVCMPFVSPSFCGHPGYLHGGIIATLLDEAMSKANRARGVVAMTRQMVVDYLHPVPLGVPLTLTARHASGSGRLHHCEAQLADASGHVLATAKAVFVVVDPARFSRPRT